MLYGTTDEFLKKFQISNLDELPDYDEVLEKLMLINAPAQDTLFHTRTILDEDENLVEQQQIAGVASDVVEETEDDEIPEFLEGEQFEVFD